MVAHNLRSLVAAEVGELPHGLSSMDMTSSKALQVHMCLAEAEMRALRKQRDFVEYFASQSVEERRAMAKRRRAEALHRREELLSKIRKLRGGISRETRPHDAAPQWAAAYSEVANYRENLSYLLSCSPYAASVAIGQEMGVTTLFDSWPSISALAAPAVTQLAGSEVSGFPSFHETLQEQVETVGKLQLQANALLSSERHRRKLQRECTADLLRDHRKLLSWCREQKDALNELNSLEELREFRLSFMSNVSVMDTNFLVLLERSELVEPNRAIRDALVEVNREWIDLAISTYQKTVASLRQAHAESEVEEDCKRWVDAIGQRVKHVLAEACALADHPNSAHEPLPGTLQKMCVDLMGQFEGVSAVMHHLGKLSELEKRLVPLEDVLHRTLLTQLSLLTNTFSGNTQFPTQREYVNRLRDVSDWLEGRATSGAYSRILKHVEQLRTVAEGLLESLADEDETVDRGY
uniref:Uncharacterized protein n=1 Tax=Trypanosoma congolense (strain IL3000) TaxID=1068625 RepID=G0UTC2_TRYCI|nr:conserved hypothetical protein [Trypanosoma congolense IL3000]